MPKVLRARSIASVIECATDGFPVAEVHALPSRHAVLAFVFVVYSGVNAMQISAQHVERQRFWIPLTVTTKPYTRDIVPTLRYNGECLEEL